MSAVNVRVAVIVRHRRTVLAIGRSPPGDPVKLPLQDKCAIREKLVLLEIADPPAPVLDRRKCGTPDALHLRCAGSHAALADPSFPATVAVEPFQRRHLLSLCILVG